jgi:hypothetical protein
MLRYLLSLVFALSVVSLSISPNPVFAYKVTVDTETGTTEVYQPNSCFHYSVNYQGSDNVLLDDLLDIVNASFSAWQQVNCSFFHFVETEPTSVDRAEFNQNKGNVNLLVWRETEEDWHVDQNHNTNTIALTSVTYDTNTGDMLDADIEFNGAYFDFGNAENPGSSDIVDLQTVITHEIGHTIGLDDLYDAIDSASTMYGMDIHRSDGSPTTDKRDLAEDDIAGLCYLYPANEDPEVCNEPVCGLDLDGTSTTCVGKGSSSNGCQVASTGLKQPAFLITRLLELL